MKASLVRKPLLEQLFLFTGAEPVCLGAASLDTVRADPSGQYAMKASEEYVVLPAAVVDTDDEEPEEYRVGGKLMSQERMVAMRDAVRQVIATHHTPLHPEIYNFNEVWTDPPPFQVHFSSFFFQ